ncbi:hypothetical protein FEM48_Zijuj12G0163200 [Ziziphus jujuba var. spinosa]|uniref:Uncharacterized protein n=1 Tax=Ziziphus jujuba var. spinosa TaxID=714518 RepID=A0A978UED0_ZIZJJ|nr:hypothetical protein FEM48_Zijuj12G0163200 [Ziziphus jujuba var. spinosa]
MKVFNLKNFFGSHFRSPRSLLSYYSTSPRSSWKEPVQVLYGKISPIGNPKVSVVPILDKWVEDGPYVESTGLLDIIKELRYYRRYNHALENLLGSIRLDLIAILSSGWLLEIYSLFKLTRKDIYVDERQKTLPAYIR